jgi:hypothetical protein
MHGLLYQMRESLFEVFFFRCLLPQQFLYLAQVNRAPEAPDSTDVLGHYSASSELLDGAQPDGFNS